MGKLSLLLLKYNYVNCGFRNKTEVINRTPDSICLIMERKINK